MGIDGVGKGLAIVFGGLSSSNNSNAQSQTKAVADSASKYNAEAVRLSVEDKSSRVQGLKAKYESEGSAGLDVYDSVKVAESLLGV